MSAAAPSRARKGSGAASTSTAVKADDGRSRAVTATTSGSSPMPTHHKQASSASGSIGSSSGIAGSSAADTGSNKQPGQGGGSDSGSTSQQNATENLLVTPEEQFFLYELENTDFGSVGLVLRAIYDGGNAEKFMVALERRIKLYDKDIEKLCSFHYQAFIEAIRDLLLLKKQCAGLRDEVELVDDDLQQSAKTLLAKTEEIVRYRKMQRNIAVAIDNISMCLPMLEKYSKLQEQMQQKRFYPALKTLEQLEHTYFPPVNQYRFTAKLLESTAVMRQRIRDASFSEFTDFLENIRKVSMKIGQLALKQATEYYDMDNVASQQARRSAKLVLGAGSTLSNRGSGGSDVAAGAPLPSLTEDFSAQDMIDFSPVYRCYHIVSVLESKEAFESEYMRHRREQAKVILTASDRPHSSLEQYIGYFHEVIGFFVVEDHIMQTAPGLVTRLYRDEMWEIAQQQITKSLNVHYGNCTDPEVMLKIKKLILLFSLTMKGYGFQTVAFYRLLQSFRDIYNEILMTECCANFDKFLKCDTYTPIVVKNETEYAAIVERFPYYRRDQGVYPIKLPFSQFVPNTSDKIRAYIKGCIRYMEHLALTHSDIDDAVRRCCNVLLERLSGSLQAFIANSRLTLVQLVQIAINQGYLEKSCESLEQYIAKSVSAAISGEGPTPQPNQNYSQTAVTRGARLKEDIFRDARSEAEQKIDESLGSKIDEFLDLSNYNWESTSSSGRASDYITDLIAFLKSTFTAFTNLPPVLARHMCMQACKHLADRLLAMLLSEQIKAISANALEQFSLDVMQCEHGFDEGALSMTFATIRQLLDLFMSSDWTSYLADYGRDSVKYIRVKPSVAANLLEKVMEGERRIVNSRGATQATKDRRKLLETVIKQLRNLP